jgi:hypothetical protein
MCDRCAGMAAPAAPAAFPPGPVEAWIGAIGVRLRGGTQELPDDLVWARTMRTQLDAAREGMEPAVYHRWSERLDVATEALVRLSQPDDAHPARAEPAAFDAEALAALRERWIIAVGAEGNVKAEMRDCEDHVRLTVPLGISHLVAHTLAEVEALVAEAEDIRSDAYAERLPPHMMLLAVRAARLPIGPYAISANGDGWDLSPYKAGETYLGLENRGAVALIARLEREAPAPTDYASLVRAATDVGALSALRAQIAEDATLSEEERNGLIGPIDWRIYQATPRAEAVEEAEEAIAVTAILSDYAQRAIEAIRREWESEGETINRILETLLPTATEFDHFYGDPKDGRGPSGAGAERKAA